MTASDRFFSPAETAKRLGVSVKALRLYEAHGLVTPPRTQAAWRVYGPDEMARLHQVLALKRLGLPLARVGELLAGRLADLDAVLALQESDLRRRRVQVDGALALLTRARARLRAGEALSPDDLSQLTRETVMTQKMTDEEYRAAFDPILRKHFSQEEIDAIGARGTETFVASGYDQESLGKAWEALVEEGAVLMTARDLTSARAKEFVRHWKALEDMFTLGDPALHQKVGGLWQEAFSDPELGPRLTLTKELWAFVRTVADGMRERGELPPRA